MNAAIHRRKYLIEEGRRTRKGRTRWHIETPEGRRFWKLSATEADRTIRRRHPEAVIEWRPTTPTGIAAARQVCRNPWTKPIPMEARTGPPRQTG